MPAHGHQHSCDAAHLMVFTRAMHMLYTDFLLPFSFNYWTLRLIHYWKYLLLYLALQFYILLFPSLQMKEEGETQGKLEICKVARLVNHLRNLRGHCRKMRAASQGDCPSPEHLRGSILGGKKRKTSKNRDGGCPN